MSEYIKKEDIKKKYRQSLIDGLTDKERDLDLSVYADVPCERFNEFVDSLPIYSFPDREKKTDETVQAIRTSIATNLYEIAHKFDESYGDAAIYLQELIDKVCER